MDECRISGVSNDPTQVEVSPLPFVGPTPTIFRVPKYIRQSDEVAYTPQVISIGPYHSREIQNEEDDIVSSLRKFKKECLRSLLLFFGKEKEGLCLDNLRANADVIKTKYSTTSNTTPAGDEVANMMLVDGCFIVRLLLTKDKFMWKYQNLDTEVPPTNGQHFSPGNCCLIMSACMPWPPTNGEMSEGSEAIGLRKDTSSRISTEAQRVPQSSYSEETNIPISFPTIPQCMGNEETQMTPPCSNPNGSTPPVGIPKIDEEIPGSLLGKALVRKLVLYDLLKLENQIPFSVIENLLEVFGLEFKYTLQKAVVNIFSEIQTMEFSIPDPPSGGYHHILHLFYLSLLPKKLKQKQQGCNGGYSDLWIPSATELKRVGIKLKRRKDHTSFLDIRFKQGVLEIPSLQVGDYTNTLFRNLIAFEQLCPDVETPLTAYIVLMDCLIDTRHDAMLLQMCGIIENRLNTDQAVADLFNKLKDQVPYTLETNYLLDVFDGINRFRKNKFRKWYAGLKREYCGNPWTLISVIAANFLLILTMLQVVYVIYAYHLPPLTEN